MRHFLDIPDASPEELAFLIAQARTLKLRLRQGIADRPLQGRSAVAYFEKPSLRTRVAIQTAMTSLGGNAIVIEPAAPGDLWKREAVKDQARVASRMADLVTIRTFSHDLAREFAAHSQAPVVNALTDHSHPTQALADLMTLQERSGQLAGRTLAYFGDGNNVARSLLELCARLGVRFIHAGPKAYRLPAEEYDRARAACPGSAAAFTEDPAEAARHADALYTDVWASMGQEQEAEARKKIFAAYRIDEALMAKAPAHAVALHCLPAHRGDEITDGVMDGPRSAVYEQAENRMHIYRSLFSWLLES